MRRIVFIIVGLFAVFTMIRAYASMKQTAAGKQEENRTEQINYAGIGSPDDKPSENL